jgi:hypothetical protein
LKCVKRKQFIQSSFNHVLLNYLILVTSLDGVSAGLGGTLGGSGVGGLSGLLLGWGHVSGSGEGSWLGLGVCGDCGSQSFWEFSWTIL